MKRNLKLERALTVLTIVFVFTSGYSIASDNKQIIEIKKSNSIKQKHAPAAKSRKAPFRIFLDRMDKPIVHRSVKHSASLLQNSLSASTNNVNRYKITAIAPITGFERSISQGINNSGQVVGRFYNWDISAGRSIDRRAFIWDKTNGARVLSTLDGESSGWGVNDMGFVSGWSTNADGYQRAVRWDTSGETIIDIGAFTNTNPEPDVVGNASCAYELNNLGNVVGNADIPNDDESFTPYHAFLYDDSSGIQDLGTFTLSYPYYQNGYSIAYDITDTGAVVGSAHNASWTLLPFIYDETNGMQELIRNPSYSESDQEWYAVAINESGMIGGHVIAASNQSLPHYWENSSSVPVQITMPGQFPYGEIYGINPSGQMTGIMWNDANEEHGFIFDMEKGVRDLNDVISPDSGWVISYARDINNAGQIAGFGDLNGEKRGFILDPINPAMPWMYLLLFGE